MHHALSTRMKVINYQWDLEKKEFLHWRLVITNRLFIVRFEGQLNK